MASALVSLGGEGGAGGVASAPVSLSRGRRSRRRGFCASQSRRGEEEQLLRLSVSAGGGGAGGAASAPVSLGGGRKRRGLWVRGSDSVLAKARPCIILLNYDRILYGDAHTPLVIIRKPPSFSPRSVFLHHSH